MKISQFEFLKVLSELTFNGRPVRPDAWVLRSEDVKEFIAVKCKETPEDYITIGKLYFGAYYDEDKDSFYIIDDTGELLFCCTEDCSHLGGGSWDIQDLETLTDKGEEALSRIESKLKTI